MKSLDKLMSKHADKIRDWYKDSDGYWLQLKPGWQSEPHSNCHGIHTETVAQMLEEFKWIERCACDECKEKAGG